jgi:hypothetical protein
MDVFDSKANDRFTRRHLLFVTAGAAAIGGSGGAAAQSPATPPAARVEPATVKRRGVGLRGHDPDRAFAGFTLFSPLPSSDRTVYLIDMQGNVVHTWQMPYPPGQSGYLTDRGTLFYNGQIPNESHVGRAPYRGGSALEMTWDGRILWEVKHPDHNHDGIRLRNGNVMLICQKPLPGEIAAKVQGGRPRTEYDNGKMDAPYLVEMTTEGKIVWEWRSWEHLDPEADSITAVQDDRDVWTVGNGVSEMPDSEGVGERRQERSGREFQVKHHGRRVERLDRVDHHVMALPRAQRAFGRMDDVVPACRHVGSGHGAPS